MNSRNEKWFETLNKLWNDIIWKEKTPSREFAERLDLNVVPVAILPFEGALYAKYIPPGLVEEQVAGGLHRTWRKIIKPATHSELLKETQNQDEIPAPGLYRAILDPNPTSWVRYLEDCDLESGTCKFCDFGKSVEKPFFTSKRVTPEGTVSGDPPKGHYVLPIFAGVTPLYVLVILSDQLLPDHFEPRFLRAMFESLAERIEHVVRSCFKDQWQAYSHEIAKAEFLAKPDQLVKLWKAFCCGIYYSSTHSLPGHSVRESDLTSAIQSELDEFVRNAAIEWVVIPDVISKRLKKWATKAASQRVFLKPHTFSEDYLFTGKHEGEFDGFCARLNDGPFWKEARYLPWIQERVNHVIDTRRAMSERLFASNALKSVLGLKANKNWRISLGLFYEWPALCGRTGKMPPVICNNEDREGKFLDRKVAFPSPYDFVRGFFDFCASLDEETSGSKPARIILRSGSESDDFSAEVICTPQLMPEAWRLITKGGGKSGKYFSDLEKLMAKSGSRVRIEQTENGFKVVVE